MSYRTDFSESADEYLVAYEHCYMLSPYQRDLLVSRARAIAYAEKADSVEIIHIERAALQLRAETDSGEGEFLTEIPDDLLTLENVPAADRDYSCAYNDRWGNKVTASGIDWAERFMDEDYRYALTHPTEWPDPADAPDWNRTYSSDDY